MSVLFRCWAEVDLRALRENLAWIRHRVGKDVNVMTVVKADAYGHGLKQIASHLMQSGTDMFGVANVAEGRIIRKVGPGWPVLMLGVALPHELEDVLRDDLMATISSWEEADALSRTAARLHRTARVHLKIDTGMGRLGADPTEVLPLFQRISSLPSLQVCGLYTHFASADDDAAFTRRQREQFEQSLRELRALNVTFQYVHAHNSAAILLEPASVYNTVRPGLLVYGIVPPHRRRSPVHIQSHLRPALTWKCRLGFIKSIRAGTSLSYGRSYLAPRNLRVATITAGYGDGYSRVGAAHGFVLVGGRRCRILGRITMDQMLVDVSALRTAKVGDEVVLMGTQGKQTIDATELARWWNTVPWEVLTNLSYRVPRVYRGGEAS